jgi:hypothetical protein
MWIPKSRYIFRTLLAHFYLACMSVGAYAEPDVTPGGWQVGVARVNITPREPMWMSGYAARTAPAKGKLTDLWVKALALQDAAGRCAALVTLDLVGIDRDLSQQVCRRIEKECGLPRSAIALCCSHTHTGPVVGRNLAPMYALDEQQQRLVAAYTDELTDNIVEAVRAALADLHPAELAWGAGQAAFAVNRRNNPEAEVPSRRQDGTLVGPVDHEGPVLAVRGRQGELRAIVFGYACHATVLDDYAWSGDWPGFAQIELERRNPGATAFFWAGCGADQNPLPRRSVDLAREYGRQMADSVEHALQSPLSDISPSLDVAYEEIELPYARLPSREQLEEEAAGADYAARRAASLLEAFQRDGKLAPSYPYPIQCWRLGKDLRWIFLGGEVVVDYSLRIKRELKGRPTWVAGYANDVMAYIPSLRVLQEGGYEGGGAMVYYGLPSPWDATVEERIINQVKTLAGREGQAAAKASASASSDSAGEAARPRLAIAPFKLDVTPPIGSPLCDALCQPAAVVDDPLSARGLVLLPEGQQPIVLLALDWVGVGNEGHLAFREALAEAAGTTPDRVAVHALHQHDAPGCDFLADRVAEEYGLGGKIFNIAFAREVIANVAAAVKKAVAHPQPVTHVGAGVGIVEKVASNRRILGPDGKVVLERMSSCRDPEAIAAPEGTIDPKCRAVALFDGDKPLAVLTYYATHPQSYYCKGRVSYDFPGVARAQRERELPGPLHLHFNGAGGNVAAGKYNDGSPEMRPVLAQRLAAGMKAAWDDVKKVPIEGAEIRWDAREIALPVGKHLDPPLLEQRINNINETIGVRINAVRHLAFLRWREAGHTITLSRLRIGDIDLVHLPGELFVEYQLAAQEMRPSAHVCVAAYGDYGPGYIGLHDSYAQGGYETSDRASRVAPSVESVMMQGIEELLK